MDLSTSLPAKWTWWAGILEFLDPSKKRRISGSVRWTARWVARVCRNAWGLTSYEVREMHGLPWGPVRQTAFDVVDGAMGRSVPRWPGFARYSPYGMVAELRALLLG